MHIDEPRPCIANRPDAVRRTAVVLVSDSIEDPGRLCTLTFRSLHVEQPKRDLPFDFRPFLVGPLDGGLGTSGSEMYGDI
jgi:hypothetical protein